MRRHRVVIGPMAPEADLLQTAHWSEHPIRGEISFDGTPIVQKRRNRLRALKPHQNDGTGIGRTFENIALRDDVRARNVRVGSERSPQEQLVARSCGHPGMLREEAETIEEGNRLRSWLDLRPLGHVGSQPSVWRPATARDLRASRRGRRCSPRRANRGHERERDPGHDHLHPEAPLGVASRCC